MSTDTPDSQETDAQPTNHPATDTATPDDLRCLCGSEELVALQTTIEIDHTSNDAERREWRLACTECGQRHSAIGRFGGGYRRLSPTLKRSENAD